MAIDVAYEVRIFIPKKEDVAENKAFSKFDRRTFGIIVKNHKQAEQKAEKIARKHNGWVASIRKAEIETVYETENIRLLEPLVPPLTHSTAIKMDEFIWLKRNKRRDNLEKEKENGS